MNLQEYITRKLILHEGWRNPTELDFQFWMEQFENDEFIVIKAGKKLRDYLYSSEEFDGYTILLSNRFGFSHIISRPTIAEFLTAKETYIRNLARKALTEEGIKIKYQKDRYFKSIPQYVAEARKILKLSYDQKIKEEWANKHYALVLEPILGYRSCAPRKELIDSLLELKELAEILTENFPFRLVFSKGLQYSSGKIKEFYKVYFLDNSSKKQFSFIRFTLSRNNVFEFATKEECVNFLRLFEFRFRDYEIVNDYLAKLSQIIMERKKVNEKTSSIKLHLNFKLSLYEGKPFGNWVTLVKLINQQYPYLEENTKELKIPEGNKNNI